jgi:hypothetical protein
MEAPRRPIGAGGYVHYGATGQRDRRATDGSRRIRGASITWLRARWLGCKCTGTVRGPQGSALPERSEPRSTQSRPPHRRPESEPTGLGPAGCPAGLVSRSAGPCRGGRLRRAGLAARGPQGCAGAENATDCSMRPCGACAPLAVLCGPAGRAVLSDPSSTECRLGRGRRWPGSCAPAAPARWRAR